jgi:ribose transport system substrate-binding protein
MQRRSDRFWRHITALAAVAGLAAAACGGSGSTSNTQTSGESAVAKAQAGLAETYKGTLRQPDTTSRSVAKGKKIVVISAGQAAISSSVPVDAAVEAAKAIGWSTSVYDAHLDPANFPALVRQAVASGADGIVADAMDCPLAQAPLQEAKAKGVKVVPIYAFDCSDPIFGAGGQAQFSGLINYGKVAQADIGKFTQQYGAAQADAVITATQGHAKVVFLNDLEFTVLKYTGQGFKDELAKCADCKVVDELDFKAADLGPTLQQKVASALLQHPEANAVKSPYTAASLLGIASAVAQSGKKPYVMGGEGFAPELDLIRGGQGIDAVNIAPSDWTGWASVDTLNSLFQGQKPADSGLGWQMVDKQHNLPASGPFVPSIDFKAAYKKAWGVA